MKRKFRKYVSTNYQLCYEECAKITDSLHISCLKYDKEYRCQIRRQVEDAKINVSNNFLKMMKPNPVPSSSRATVVLILITKLEFKHSIILDDANPALVMPKKSLFRIRIE